MHATSRAAKTIKEQEAEDAILRWTRTTESKFPQGIHVEQPTERMRAMYREAPPEPSYVISDEESIERELVALKADIDMLRAIVSAQGQIINNLNSRI